MYCEKIQFFRALENRAGIVTESGNSTNTRPGLWARTACPNIQDARCLKVKQNCAPSRTYLRDKFEVTHNPPQRKA